jgi:hypothetical protein
MLSFFLASNAPHELHTRRGVVRAFAEDAALDFLHQEVQVGTEVFVYPYYPMYYFLANVKNPSRYSILMYNINTQSQFAETIAALERKRVKYVFWDTFVAGSNFKIWFPNYVHPPDEQLHLERYLQTHYRVLAVKNGFRILRRVEG